MSDVDWPALNATWRDTALKERRALYDRAMEAARKAPASYWDWFATIDANDRMNGSLAGAVLLGWLGSAPVPRRMIDAMLRAAVEERNPSFNRKFIEPCARAYGRRAVVERLLVYLERGTNSEKAGAANALYWASMFGEDDLGDLRAVEKATLLRIFIDVDDLDVRRAIIGKLPLRTKDHPSEAHADVAKAIEIARSSGDAYLEHRVEIQLGSGGPFKPLPPREN